jgi:hypothetical protein
MDEYSTLEQALESNWHMMLGAWDKGQMEMSAFHDSGAGTLGYYLPQAFFFLFSFIIILMLLNMFLAIVIDVFMAEKEEAGKSRSMVSQFCSLTKEIIIHYGTCRPFYDQHSLTWYNLLDTLHAVQADVKRKPMGTGFCGKPAPKPRVRQEGETPYAPELYYVRRKGKTYVAVLHISQMFPTIKGDVLKAVDELFQSLECELSSLFEMPASLVTTRIVAEKASVAPFAQPVTAEQKLETMMDDMHSMADLVRKMHTDMAELRSEVRSLKEGSLSR